MSEQSTSFPKLERCLADIKIWQKDVRSTPDDKLDPEVKNQLVNNVAPFFSSLVQAVSEELGEQAAILADQADGLDMLINQEGDMLQPEMANNLTNTLVLGMSIVAIMKSEKIQLNDDLKNKKLQDGMKLFEQNATILLDQIEAVTLEDEEENDDNDESGEGHTQSGVHGEGPQSGLHGEGGDGEEHDTGGAPSVDNVTTIQTVSGHVGDGDGDGDGDNGGA